MADRASLKRKLDELVKDQRGLRDRLLRIDSELEHYWFLEMQLFLQKRCSFIVKFYRHSPNRCKLNNGLRVLIDKQCTVLYVLGKGDSDKLGALHANYGIVLHDLTWGFAAIHLPRLADVLPDLDRLVHVHLPAWLKASEELDVESLVMSRTLRWISKEVGGQWPDIISGNFPI